MILRSPLEEQLDPARCRTTIVPILCWSMLYIYNTQILYIIIKNTRDIYILIPAIPAVHLPIPSSKDRPPVVVGLACHVQREENRRHKGHTAAVDASQDLLTVATDAH